MKTKGSKSGRYGAIIDKKQFEGLCSIMCTEEEICAFFHTSHDTLNRWTKQEYGETAERTIKSKSQVGKISLRRAQFTMAQKNPSMAIWLGKQYLGQSEKIEEIETDVIEIINDVKN